MQMVVRSSPSTTSSIHPGARLEAVVMKSTLPRAVVAEWVGKGSRGHNSR
jgi:hypothetical protein